MKIKTSELIGPALDWAVAKCEGTRVMRCGAGPSAYLAYTPKRSAYKLWEPTKNWKQGGPIIEREKHIAPLWEPSIQSWYACKSKGTGAHPTSPLIAAMRCYVASKLGDEVDIPYDLT